MKKIVFFILIFLVVFIGCQNNNRILAKIEKGDQAYARRHYLKACEIWRSVYAESSDMPELLAKLSECCLKLGRVESAVNYAEKAALSAPGISDYQIRLAQLYMLAEKFSMAQKITKNLRNKNASHADLDLIDADLCVLENRPKEAEIFYRSAVLKAKDSQRAMLKLAIFLLSVDREIESRKLFALVFNNPQRQPEIYMLMADYFLLENNKDKAESSILSAISLEPEESFLKYYLLDFYISTTNYKEARTLLEEMLNSPLADDAQLWMTLADLNITENRLEETKQIIDRLLEKKVEENAKFELLQGKYWLYSGNFILATSHLKTAIDLEPGYVNARYFLGLTHLLNEKAKLSENTLIQTLQIQPDHHDALLLIAALLYKKEEYELSLRYLDQMIKAFPEDTSGKILMGLNFLALEDYTKAAIHFENALVLCTQQAAPLYYLGYIFELLDKEQKALEGFKQLSEQYPELLDVFYRYCIVLMKKGHKEIVIQMINEKIKVGMGSPEFYYVAAKIASAIKSEPLEERLLRLALQSDNCLGESYLLLAKLYQQMGRFTDSYEVLSRCTEEKPEFKGGWLAMTQYYNDLQDFQTSLSVMEKAYQKFQTDPIIQANLAWLLLINDEDPGRALSIARTAYEKMPDKIAIADTLGWAYYRKGIYSQALWLLSDIVKKDPENSHVQYHLGMTYYKHNEPEKAAAYLEKAKHSPCMTLNLKEIDTVLKKLKRERPKIMAVDATTDDDVLLPSDPESILSFPAGENSDNDLIAPLMEQ